MDIVRTEAESALIARASDNQIEGPEWLKDLQDAARDEFQSLGLPHRRVEEWKYTDLKSGMRTAFDLADAGGAVDVSAEAIMGKLPDGLAELEAYHLIVVNGVLNQGLSETEISGGVEVLSLKDALLANVEWIKPLGAVQQADRDAIQALNLATMQGGVCVRVPEGAKLDKPLHVIFVTTGAGPRAVASRLFFDIGREADVQLVESHVSLEDAPVESNVAGEFIVGSRAKFRHMKMTMDHNESVHLANFVGRLGEETDYGFFQLVLDGGISRNQFEMRYDGNDAIANISGAALLQGKSHADLTLVMDHAATGCVSRELFKTVLDDQARAVFQGKVIVQPGAQKTDGEMMSKALLLSDDAEFDSKPELEIYADDVLCGHGATTGQIDEDLLFYLRARGIPENDARALLIQAFFGEALELVEHEAVRDVMIEHAVNWYGKTR